MVSASRRDSLPLSKNQGLGFGVLVPLVEVFVEVSLAVLDPLGLVALP